MLECNIGWTKRGVPFWKENRSDGELYHFGVSNPDPDCQEGLSHLWWGKVLPRVHFPATNK